MVVVGDRRPLVLEDLGAEIRGGMERELERGVAEPRRQDAEISAQQPGQVGRSLRGKRFVRARVLAGQDPRFEGRAGRVGNHHQEERRQPHHPIVVGLLLAEDVAEEAAPLVLIVLPGFAQLPAQVVEDHGNRGHPRVRMADPRPRLAVPPRDQDVADLGVALQVLEPVPVHPEDALQLVGTHAGRRVLVARALDDQFAGPARRDLVVHPDAFTHQVPLHPEVRVRFRDDPHLPARAVGGGPLLPIGRDLRRGARLVAGTEGALGPCRLGAPPRSHQHPLASRRILPEIAQISPSPIVNEPTKQ